MKKEETGVKIEKIELKVGRKVIPLDLAEARELHKILADLFGKETVQRVYEPIWIKPWTWERPYITWQTYTGTIGGDVFANQATGGSWNADINNGTLCLSSSTI